MAERRAVGRTWESSARSRRPEYTRIWFAEPRSDRSYAAGELDRLEQWVLGMRIKDVIGFMDVSLAGGLLKGERVTEFFRRNFVDRPVEQLTVPFAAVATALQTGAEVWLREASTVEPVRASIALPAFLTPVRRPHGPAWP